MLLDQVLNKRGVTFHGCVMETCPSSFGLGIDEGILIEQGLTHIDATKFRGQVKGTSAFMVKDVNSSIIFQKYLNNEI